MKSKSKQVEKRWRVPVTIKVAIGLSGIDWFIFIRRTSLLPKEHDAKIWDFVTWISEDSQKHRIKSGKANDGDSEREFDSGPYTGVLALTEKGRMFSHQFTSLKSYEYFCENHPGEVGRIIIKPNHHPTNHNPDKSPKFLISVLPL